MNFLFLHKTFPGQFKYLIEELAKDSKNRVVFISDNRYELQVKGVERIMYPFINPVSSQTCHLYLTNYMEATLTAQAAANIALGLKANGFKPDIVIGFSGWGDALFMKDIFPDAVFLSYYEWFYTSDGPEVIFSKLQLSDEDKASIRCKNSKLLLDLYSSDAGLSPTHWQKSQFPKEFQDKIRVIHDGIDVDFFKPNPDAKFTVKGKNLELSAKDEVITYVTRGMEPIRGFEQFMEAIEQVLKKRPKAHVVIAGEDVVCYGQQLEHGTYKQLMLQKLKLDMNRVHFVDLLPFDEYLSLLQISSVHVYLTYPYVLSWSFLQAMATGCCIVGSSTEPVLEVMKNNYNGLLADFYSVEHIVKRILYALENKDKMQEIRANARKTVVENYALKDMLKKQIEYINELVKK